MRRAILASRTTVLFIMGMAGAVYEIVWEQTDRPALLALIAGMLGLPAFINMDSQRNASKEKEGGP